MQPFMDYLQSHGQSKGEAMDYSSYVVVSEILTARFGISPKPYVKDQLQIERVDKNIKSTACDSDSWHAKHDGELVLEATLAGRTSNDMYLLGSFSLTELGKACTEGREVTGRDIFRAYRSK
jgi:hypothetical protein